MAMDGPRFGTLLRSHRLANGLSQESLAERAAMSVNGISALERGTNQTPQRKTLELLVKALGLNADQARAFEAAAARRSRPRAGAQHARRGDFPRNLTPFFGREEDVAAVSEFVETVSLLTLTGPGGIGKTRLALEVAERMAHRFRDGVRFVDLAPLRDADSVLWTLGSVEAAPDRNMLLVIDNCEHVMPAVAAAVEALVRACPGIRVLATSRQSLNVAGEQVYRVPPLERSAAADLFEERAKRADGSIAMTPDDRAAVERIVTRLDGIALAIELAAARIKVLTLAQLEQALSERLHILSGGSTSVPRQHTMRAAIDWSYDLLDERERRLFRQLWLFPSTFSLDAALAICGEDGGSKWHVFETLASLVDKSLVNAAREGNDQRYRLLETTRAYVAEDLDDGEAEMLRRRHAEYYCDLAQYAAEALGSADSTTAWARTLEPDLENFRGALDWALQERGDVEAGVSLLTRLQEFWIVEGLASEAARRANEVLEREYELSNASRAALWLTIARMRQQLFAHPTAMLEAAGKARELYQASADHSGLALAIRQQAAAHMRLGAYAQARSEFAESLELYRALGDRRMVARGLGYLASLLQVQGEYAQAREILLDVLQTAQSCGDDRMIPTVSMNLAETEFALGDYESAATRARENLGNEVLQKSCDMIATQEANLSVYLLALGKCEEARAMALASIEDAAGTFVAVPLQHLAASIADSEPVSAAKILGYVEEAFKATAFTRERTERFTYERLTAALEAAVGAQNLSAYRAQGATLNERQILELART